MNTPLYTALCAQLETQRERFFMPGHKGILPPPLQQAAQFDFTELPLTGSLFDATEPFLQIEKSIANFYGGGAALISAGGSSISIKAMLALFCPPQSKVIMARSCHVAAVASAAILDLSPVWVLPDTASGIETPGIISAGGIKAALRQNPDAAAVYITSPDYFGTLWDIEGIAAVCRQANVPLLVDNAHGAHLAFFGCHPMQLGADACCDSFHKTLPCMTGASVLQLKDAALAEKGRKLLGLFGSTSPSYPVMLSIDFAVGALPQLKAEFLALAEKVTPLIAAARKKGIFATCGACDPVRLSLTFPKGQRQAIQALLYDCGIEAEYISDRHIVLLISPQNALEPVEKLLERLPQSDEIPILSVINIPKRAMSIRKATFSPTTPVPIEQAVGKIAAETLATCPPGLPLIMPGEVVESTLANFFSGTIDAVVL